MSFRFLHCREWVFALGLSITSICSAATVGPVADGCQVVSATHPARAVVSGDESAFPPPQLDIRTPFAPTSFPSDGRHYLIYEVHLENESKAAVAIKGIEVLNAIKPTMAPLVTFDVKQLSAILRPIGDDAAIQNAADGIHLGSGRTAVAYMCLAFDGDAPVPPTLSHRVLLDNTAVTGPAIRTTNTPLKVLAPPVSGNDWAANDAPSNASHHRLGLFVFGGQAGISRRYAIDWVNVKNGSSFSGDPLDVHAYYAYGHNVLAVADGVVVNIKDGYPNNVPRTPAGFKTALPITIDNVGGNSIVIDIGDGQYGYYAHLQAGSLRVKKGDRVKRGQVLAQIGASGDARQPHLHFQLGTGTNALEGEGIPYVIDQYQLKTADGWETRKDELPISGMSINFGASESK